MTRVLTHVGRTLALIMAFGLAAYASDGHFGQHKGSDANHAAATQCAEGHPGLRGHPGRHKDGHLD